MPVSPKVPEKPYPPVRILMRIAVRPGVMLAGGRPSLRLPDVERYEGRILEQSDAGWLVGFGPEACEHAARLALDLRASVPPLAVALHAPCIEPIERSSDVLSDLAAIARPGEALATEAFCRLAKERYGFEPVRDGIFRLGRPRAPLEGAFVGRASELQHLRSCAETASQGRPLVVSIQGEPGIGKSRLLAEFLRDHPGAFEACSRENERQRPYALLSSLLVALGFQPGRLAAELGRAGTDLDVLMGLGSDAAPIQPRHRQFRAFVALNQALRARLGATPCVFVLEDLHWADEASLAWLDSLVAELAYAEQSPPWLLVLSERGSDLLRRYGGMGLGALAIRLEPLEETDARSLVEAIAPELDERLGATVLRRAEGNPLYLREFARLAHEAGTASAMPELLGWELERRLENRGLAERRVLELAAVLGPTFELAHLERLCGLASFKQLIANLVGADLLAVSGETGSFRHHLLHEAAYRAIPVARRQELHSLAAHLLSEQAAPDLLAHHLLLGTRPATARPHLLRAAAEARRGHALEQARQHLTRASMAGDEADSLSRTIRLELAEVLLTLGELEAARRELAGLRPVVPDASRVRLALLMSQLDERRGDYGSAIAYLHEGRSAACSEAERARVLLAEASLRLRQGAFAECRTLAVEAGGLLGGDRGLDRALAHSLEGIATYRLEGPEPALAAYRAALALRQDAGDPAAIAGSQSNLGVAFYELGRWDEAQHAFEHALETFRSVGERWQTTVVLNNMGHLHLNRGQVAAAEGCYRETLAIKREMGEEPGVAIALCNLGNALCRRAAFDEARRSLQEAVLMLERLGEQETIAEVYQVRGMVELAAGEPVEARLLLERVLDRSRAQGREGPRAIAMRGLSDLAARAGRWDEARELAWESVELNDRLHNPLELGRSLLALGAAHRGLGDEVRARDALAKARALFERLGAFPDLRAAEASLA